MVHGANSDDTLQVCGEAYGVLVAAARVFVAVWTEGQVVNTIGLGIQIKRDGIVDAEGSLHFLGMSINIIKGFDRKTDTIRTVWII